MHLRWISYIIPLTCLIMTVSLVTYKISTSNQKWSISLVSGYIQPTQWEYISNEEKNKEPQWWADLSTSLSRQNTQFKFVYQQSQPYLLINEYHIIPLPTNVYSGTWTWVRELYKDPLVVYYQYQVPWWKWYSYLYQLQKGSSRALDNLTLLWIVRNVSLFGLKQDGWYRGLSALYDGELVTLYTWEYRTIHYLWDTLKLNNSQEIYLPLRTSWS